MADVGFKYGLLGLDESDEPDPKFRRFEGDTYQWFTSAAAIAYAPDEFEHWKDTIGSLEWDATIANEQRTLVLRIRSDRPSVLDLENRALTERLGRAWLAWIVPPPCRPSGHRPWVVTGEAADDAPKGLLKSVRDFARYREVVRPFYAHQDIYWDRKKKPKGLRVEPTFEKWVSVDDLLNQKPPRILNVAIRVLVEALARSPLEARIPELVRASECILGLPSGTGRVEFAGRALRLVPTLSLDWFVGRGVQNRLLQLYQHRSDCVHGNIPFEELHRRGAAGTAEAARSEYLAELLARECVVFALERRGLWHHFESRDLLERAWQSGAIA